MTITPITAFGNMSGANMPLGSALGGLANLFASLLGGNLESLEGLKLGEGSSDVGLDGLLSSLMQGEGEAFAEGSLGGSLSALLGGADISKASQANMLKLLKNSTALLDSMPLNASAQELDTWLESNAGNGDAKIVFQRIVVEIQQTTYSLQASGVDISSLENSSALAAAFEELGMEPAEAAAKAARIEQALAMMKAQLKNELSGAESMQFIPAMFDMMPSVGESFSVDMSATQTSIQASRTLIAFEASSSLSTGDMGMAVLKGEPITVGEGSFSKPLSVPMAEASGEATVSKLQQGVGDEVVDPSSEFQPLKTSDLKVAEAAVSKAEGANVAAQAGVKEVVGKKDVEPTLWGANSAEAKVDAEKADAKRRVSEIAADKVLKSDKAQDLFTVKPKPQSEGLTFEVADENGDVINLDGVDESMDNVMDIVNRKTSFEARVEGGSHQAMARQANIASQVDIQMRQLARQGGGEVKFRLDPPELGELDIKLKISQGTVKGTIVVQSSEVAETLARDLRILQQGFEEAGLELHEEGIVFQIRDDNPQGGNQQQGGQQSGQDSEFAEDESFINVAGVEEGSTAKWVKPDSLLDVSV